ncbi:MAG TPA: rhomboid family intramembrane serine protease [Candidatus Sulfomarinibacteraceae bacterium]|nr:rhomboid family intramembrane serine protease [Candidatus Sulfomarinibacteraceae bacterium]
MNEQGAIEKAAARFREQVTLLGGIVAVAWILELIDVLLLRQALNQFGVIPRQPSGLLGIIFMPFLHGGLAHLAANTLPFVILGWLVLLRRTMDFVWVTALTMLITGGGLWFLGSPRVTYIGASGLIFGYFGFLLLRGYFERSAQSLLISGLVVIFYGGLLLGVLPQRPGISWEAHLLGLLSGILAARLLANRAAESDSATDFEHTI